MECTELIKLTDENWDKLTQHNYHVEFLNDRNAIRSVIYDLLQIDNQIKCMNVGIQSLKTGIEKQLESLGIEVKHLEGNEFLSLERRNELIAEQVKLIEDTNESFRKEFDKYKIDKEHKCQALSQNVEKLFQVKSKFKYTHQRQVDSLKRFRMFCSRDIRPAVDVRCKSVDRKFCDEWFYINSCEKDIKHIFPLLDDKSSHSGLCSTESSSSDVASVCRDFFTDFAWMRNEQQMKRNELFEYYKKHLAKDIVAALASMYVRKPEEPIKFIANYLKHLKNNDFRVAKQVKIYEAAKSGEGLFPEKKE